MGNAVAPNGYALGVYAQQVLGHPAVWHDGLIFGFHTLLLYFSDRDIAVAVVTNAFPAPAGGNPQLIALAVAKATLAAP